MHASHAGLVKHGGPQQSNCVDHPSPFINTLYFVVDQGIAAKL